jgi:hypothetical protein
MLQQTCSNAVPTTCQQDVFTLVVPSLLTTCYDVVELNRLVTSWAQQTCYVVSDNLVATWQNNSIVTTCWQTCYKPVANTSCWQVVRFFINVYITRFSKMPCLAQKIAQSESGLNVCNIPKMGQYLQTIHVDLLLINRRADFLSRLTPCARFLQKVFPWTAFSFDHRSLNCETKAGFRRRTFSCAALSNQIKYVTSSATDCMRRRTM